MSMARRMFSVALFALLAAAISPGDVAMAQRGRGGAPQQNTQTGPPGETARVLAGAIDIHVHSAPDDRPRSIDAVEVAKLAHAKGMRAIVLKNHYDPTGPLAYVVRKEVPGI